jgi:hypothetical protein
MTVPQKMMLSCQCEDDGGKAYRVWACPRGGEFADMTIRPPALVEFSDRVSELYIVVPDGGYWPLAFRAPKKEISGVVPRLPAGPIGWWHRLHGIDGKEGLRGKGIRIGVIDEALPRQERTSPLGHIDNIGGVKWEGDQERAFTPLKMAHPLIVDHAVGVCSLLAARPEYALEGHAASPFEGMAPWADVFFCAAGSANSVKINPGRLANAIDHLSGELGCHIITFSTGDLNKNNTGIGDSIWQAAERGTLCFAAAGNRGGRPHYPARHEDCLSVGAVGDERVAPQSTWDADEARRSSKTKSGDLFYWHGSARGRGVKFVGAGVSVFFTDPQGRSMSAIGTSYAAPIVAGTAAVILSKDEYFLGLKRDRARVRYALGKLQGMSSHVFPGLTLYGMLSAV